MPTNAIKSISTQVSIDPAMSDKIAYIQCLSVNAGHKKPSVTAIVSYCVDQVVDVLDDLIEEKDAERLHLVAEGISQRQQPVASAFAKPPRFNGRQSYRALSREAVRNRFRNHLEHHRGWPV